MKIVHLYHPLFQLRAITIECDVLYFTPFADLTVNAIIIHESDHSYVLLDLSFSPGIPKMSLKCQFWSIWSFFEINISANEPGQWSLTVSKVKMKYPQGKTFLGSTHIECKFLADQENMPLCVIN